MSPWLETLGAICLVALGTQMGRRLTRGPMRRWLSGFLAAFALVIIVAAPRRYEPLLFVEPFHTLTAGRRSFAILALAFPPLFTIPITRLTVRRQQVLLGVLMALVLLHACILPFLEPALFRGYFGTLRTVVDANGVCRQSKDFSCGPAAAVTALTRLGLHADEGELAILAHTSSSIGTPADLLCDAIEERYGPETVRSEYRFFDSIDALAAALKSGEVLAVIKYGFMLDHYVAMLAIQGDSVIVGDPLAGRRSLTRAQFESVWRGSGIVIHRAMPRVNSQ